MYISKGAVFVGPICINVLYSNRLKQRGQVADMNTIIKAVNQDWSSLVSRMKLQEAELRDTVHSSLGAKSFLMLHNTRDWCRKIDWFKISPIT